MTTTGGDVERERLSQRNAEYIHVHSTGVQDAQLDYSINETKTCQNYATPPNSVLTPAVFSAVCTCMSVYAVFHRPRADQRN